MRQRSAYSPPADGSDRLIAAHTPIVVNSDAHVPDKIDSGRKYGIELLSRLEKLHNIDPTTPTCQ